MICPYCNNELPDDSKFCQYCGNKLQSAKIDDVLFLTAPKKKRLRGKTVAVLSVFVILVILFGSYLCSYSLAKKNAQEGNFTGAAQLLLVPSLTKLHDPLLPSYVSVGILYEDGKYAEAKEAYEKLSSLYQEDVTGIHDVLEKYYKYYNAVAVLKSTGKNDSDHVTSFNSILSLSENGFSLAIEGLNDAKEFLYQYAIKRYHDGATQISKNLFSKIPDYKRSQDYMVLCGSNYSALYKLIDFENAKEVIINNCPEDFLRGTWKTADQEFYFTIDQDGTCFKSLPSTDSPGSYYGIQNGIYFTYSKDDSRIKLYAAVRRADLDDPAITKQFQFVIRDKDTISVYCYRDGNTYRLYRQ